MILQTHYLRCGDLMCGWIGVQGEVLQAPSPFDPEEELEACPVCNRINDMRRCCDEPECFEEATCGTPTQTVYRRTCGKHRPKE